MHCQSCSHLNNPEANFCRNCGTQLRKEKPTMSEKKSDKLLVSYIFLLFGFTFIQVLFQRLAENWYDVPYRYINSALWLIQSLLILLIPFSIKNRNYKIASFVITAILAVYYIFANLSYYFI